MSDQIPDSGSIRVSDWNMNPPHAIVLNMNFVTEVQFMLGDETIAIPPAELLEMLKALRLLARAGIKAEP